MMKLLMCVLLASGAIACVSAGGGADDPEVDVSQVQAEISSSAAQPDVFAGPTPKITCRPAPPPGQRPCCEFDEQDPHLCRIFKVCIDGVWVCP